MAALNRKGRARSWPAQAWRDMFRAQAAAPILGHQRRRSVATALSLTSGTSKRAMLVMSSVICRAGCGCWGQGLAVL